MARRAGTVTSPSIGYIEFFEGQQTDENGDVTLTLVHTPTLDSSVFVQTNGARRVAHFQSRTDARVTVRVTKLVYDKASAISTPTDLPSGVTVDSTVSGFSLTSSAAQSPGINPNTGIGGTSADDATHQHTVTVNKLTSHKHTLSHTETDQPVAASETLNFVVIYR